MPDPRSTAGVVALGPLNPVVDRLGRPVHDLLTALRHNLPLDRLGTRLRPNGEWYLKSAAQMRRRWRHA